MSRKIPPFRYNKCGSPTANKKQKGIEIIEAELCPDHLQLFN